MKTLGIDISSRSTGYSLIEDHKLIEFGKINPTKSMSLAQKMLYFHNELKRVIDKLQPDDIAIEDVIQVRSVSVLKILARFNGVAIVEAYRYLQRDPELFEPSKWKKLLTGSGSQKKCETQLFVCEKYNLLSKEKIEHYQQRIDEAKKLLKDCGHDTKDRLKQLKKDLRKCKKKEPDDKEKIQDIENQIKELDTGFKKSKKTDKKISSGLFDSISLDIYTETLINEDIADSIGVAIAAIKTNGTKKEVNNS